MPRRFDDDDDYEDDRPRRRRRARRSARKSSSLPWILGSIGVLFFAVIGIAVVVLVLKGRGLTASSGDVPGVVAHWSFEDGPAGRIEDRSGHGNHATVVGARTGLGGPSGQALYLNGQPDQYCDIGASEAFNFRAGSSFTVAGWFQTVENEGTIFSLRHTTLPTQVEVIVRNGRLLMIVGDDNDRGRQAIVWSQRPNDGGWHHFALVRADQRVEMFLDGVSQGVSIGLDAGGPITTNIRAIGCERLWATTNDFRWGRPGFAGGIDEVYIFDRALSGDEVLKLMKR